MKLGRIKDPLYKDSYFGITPPTFIPPFEAPDPWPKLQGRQPQFVGPAGLNAEAASPGLGFTLFFFFCLTGFRVYLNPEEPTFLGFLTMISFSKVL